jgi:hypothetical protein
MKIFMHNVSNGSQRALNVAKKIKKTTAYEILRGVFFIKIYRIVYVSVGLYAFRFSYLCFSDILE